MNEIYVYNIICKIMYELKVIILLITVVRLNNVP